MPITQDRMIALIDASTEVLNCYSNAMKEIRRRIGYSIEDESMQMIHIMSVLEILVAHQPPATTIETILREQAHFQARRKHNDRTRAAIKRMRERQRASRVAESREDARQYIENVEQKDQKELPSYGIDETKDFTSEAFLGDLHKALWDAYQRRTKPYWFAYEAIAVYARLTGEKNNDKISKHLAEILATKDIIITGEHSDELIVLEPKETDEENNETNEANEANNSLGGLLPSRTIGLKKRASIT